MIVSMSSRVRPTRKLRRTFTLSPQNVAYIEKQARERNMPSLSAFLDELLQEKTREQKLAEIEANTIAYYDSLTDEERLVQDSVARFVNAFPQYRVHHLLRTAGVESALARLGGVAVAGAAYRGVGIPACIASGRSAARALL